MKNKGYAYYSAMCLCIVLALTGCRFISASEKASKPETISTLAPDRTAQSGTAAADTDPAWEDFGKAFRQVDQNPLNESIQYALWLAAGQADENTGSSSDQTASPLKQLADKRVALSIDPGIHFTEVSSAMGFETSAEYWIHDGKFKKVEETKTTVFDGQTYIQYDPEEKTGNKYTKEFMQADINIQLNGMLPSLAVSPYQQKEDQTINGFDCSVFFMDMEMMGMKGNTLFVDKQTGMLIKYQLGTDETGISTTVTKMEIGGFGDDVFTVPADITVKDGMG